MLKLWNERSVMLATAIKSLQMHYQLNTVNVIVFMVMGLLSGLKILGILVEILIARDGHSPVDDT